MHPIRSKDIVMVVNSFFLMEFKANPLCNDAVFFQCGANEALQQS